MEVLKVKFLLLCTLVLLVSSASATFGDWDQGDPHKMHYPQLPDPNGWDINFNMDYMFDDWKCTESGYVTDIHFWLSCKGDVWDPEQTGETCPIARLLVYIYADMAADDPCNQYEFSHPTGEPLWRMDMDPFDPNLIRHAGTGRQGWIDWQQPPYPLVIYDDHTHYYQINLTDIPEPFFQEQGTIYWLAIHLHTYNDEIWTFGWKSSQNHWNDDAVYFYGGWYEMRDPDSGESMDMAFVINSEEQKPLASHTKWSQPPVEVDPNSYIPTYCGWDEQSHNAVEPGALLTKVVADDFRCIGSMPVTSIRWWGSFYDWEWSWAQGTLPQVLPEKWWIGFWSNVPAMIPPYNLSYSYPDKLLHSITIPADRVDFNEVGSDEYYGYYPYDICYRYKVKLEPNEVFWQDDFNEATYDDIYWISIVAEYNDADEPYYKWGWKSRPWSWQDDAVTFGLAFKPDEGFANDPLAITPIEDPYWNESFDMSFELDTDPNYIKWEQLYTGIRNWPHYEDVLSTATPYQATKKWEQVPDTNWSGLHCHDYASDGFYNWITLADDWHCEGGEVTDLHWWGSYEDRGSGIDHFHLSIHEPNTQIPCVPGQEVWGVDVPFASLNEIDTGMVQNTGQTVYLYKYELDTPFEQVVDQNYWFDITAYSVDPYQPALWYWQEMARHLPPVLCPAVEGVGPGLEWVPIEWQFYGYSDMAFVITSTAEANEPNGPIVADDWKCTRRIPVEAISWWGSYLGYQYPACGDPTMSLPVPPNYFRLNIWTDEPADACVPGSYSHPKEIIWHYDAKDYDEVLVGYDKKPEGDANEPVFRYSVKLPEDEWFKQTEVNEVFWLSVVAVYDENTPNYDWGWTNHEHVFNDDAVSGRYNSNSGEWVWEELKDQTGASEDMSFILFTDPNDCIECADYNNDGIVNFYDYAIFALDWMWAGPAGGYANGDLNCSGKVDFADLEKFCLQWLNSCP